LELLLELLTEEDDWLLELDDEELWLLLLLELDDWLE
jgi:hypothetical protein